MLFASRVKIEVSSICDADRVASPASPISSLVHGNRYPRSISSLVIHTWVNERQTEVGRRHGKTIRCKSPYKAHRRKSLEEGEMT